jgi:hypothetical protein
MNDSLNERRRKSFTLLRVIYNVTMGILILSMGIFMLWGDRFPSEAVNNFVADIDPLVRYLFGGLCLLYGGFRLYRGIKKQY